MSSSINASTTIAETWSGRRNSSRSFAAIPAAAGVRSTVLRSNVPPCTFRQVALRSPKTLEWRSPGACTTIDCVTQSRVTPLASSLYAPESTTVT